MGNKRKKIHGGIFYLIRNMIITLIVAAVAFYVMLPALNPKDPETYFYVLVLLAVFAVLQGLSTLTRQQRQMDFGTTVVELHPREMKNFWSFRIPLILAALIVVVAIVGTISSAALFRAKDYAALLPVSTGDFSQDVQQISFDQIPMLDKDSAEKLGDRKLGELSDMVSQFEVNDAYSQINYQDSPVRVTYLDYGDVIKWFNNRSDGLPAYILLNMVTQEVTVRRLEEGMKYSPSDMFGHDLYRHLRFQYPTLMFDDINFEIDEDGDPYWICSVIDKTIGLFGGTDVVGAVIMDAVSGESTYYALADIPSWVDRVFAADLIVEQYNYYGQYSGGFLNSMFGQKNVTVTTDGYNYIAQDDDVWVYTGVTSVTGDESNVGFILSNQRTKETRYYPIAGAEEFSAMNSAEGMVQNLKYIATFPLLLNISGQPTYFMALKDASELVKMYAMVNVQQYQVVATGYTVAETQQNYNALLTQNGIQTEVAEDILPAIITVEGPVEAVRSQVVEGSTVYYLMLEGQWYAISAADCEEAILVDTGAEVRITVPAEAAEAAILPAQGMEILSLTE